VRELQPGLWHWHSRHPEWSDGEPWGPEVSSYAIDDGTQLVFFDPLAVPTELDLLARERRPVVVLTAPWHERGTEDLVQRLSAPVYVARPDEGSPDVAWLLGNSALESHVIAAGDPLPLGAQSFAGRRPNDLVLWIESRGVVIAGDTLVDFGRGGLEIADEWLWGVPRAEIVGRLRPLLDLPVQLVLPAHGQPTDRAALERALAE